MKALGDAADGDKKPTEEEKKEDPPPKQADVPEDASLEELLKETGE